ncbi:LCP family protein [Lachnoclostridium sp. Marseille-P6806]|uniref:LCP family protein n=1 Tax=Lachnoclostridium sp. Marseille-P6806 TaxID=2364793 RepID=UPI001F5F1179|nr:LCP family protein [Lachnoclostridium sp. Marseille-P6806]
MAGRYRSDRNDSYQDYDDYEEYAQSRGRGDDYDSYDRRYDDGGYEDYGDSYGAYDDGHLDEDGGEYYADDYGDENGYEDGYEDDRYDDYGMDGGYGAPRSAYERSRRVSAPQPSRARSAGRGRSAGSRPGNAGGRRQSAGDRGRSAESRAYGGRSVAKASRSKGRRDERADSRRGGNGRGDGKKGKGKLILFVIEILILLAVLVFFYFSTKIGKVGKISINEDKIAENLNDTVAQETIEGTMKGYMNIALFGVDSTKGDLTQNTRSDTIMIASINQDTQEIRLCSVYRDTYLNLGNDSYNKCNAAYAKGGPEQAINMLNMNLDMNITNFVTVGFGGLTAAIDDLGGVDIEVDDAERPHLNSYQLTMSEELNYPYQEVTQTGMLHLNGLQATAYCRIRYTAGDDFKRAERQREVLMATMEKAKKADAATLTKVVDDVSSKIVTNFDITQDILPMALQAASYTIVDQNGFPQADLRTTGTVGQKGSCVIPRDLDANVVWLHRYLFGDESYTVSGQVEEYSQKIASDTAGIG